MIFWTRKTTQKKTKKIRNAPVGAMRGASGGIREVQDSMQKSSCSWKSCEEFCKRVYADCWQPFSTPRRVRADWKRSRETARTREACHAIACPACVLGVYAWFLAKSSSMCLACGNRFCDRFSVRFVVDFREKSAPEAPERPPEQPREASGKPFGTLLWQARVQVA